MIAKNLRIRYGPSQFVKNARTGKGPKLITLFYLRTHDHKRQTTEVMRSMGRRSQNGFGLLRN